MSNTVAVRGVPVTNPSWKNAYQFSKLLLAEFH
jgi:hypothetical protein